MATTTLQIRRLGPVTWVLMDRAAQRNAFNPTMIAELTDVFRSLSQHPDDSRVVVLADEADTLAAWSEAWPAWSAVGDLWCGCLTERRKVLAEGFAAH